MDPTKQVGEARNPNGSLKEAHEIEWFNDPDDPFPISNRRSTPPRRSGTQTTLSTFGVTTHGQRNLAEDGAVGGSTNNVSTRPPRIRKLPAKFKDGLTAVSVGQPRQVPKTKRNKIITDEDKAQPPKKKIKVGGLDENGPDSETDDISVNEGPNSSTTRVFSQVPEENQVTRANTEVSSNLDGSGNASTGETTAGRGGTSDGDEWEYSQLDEMATKDAVTLKKPKLYSSINGDIRIADLVAVFEDGDHPESKLPARRCRLCNTWLTGNVSTCRTHIIRQWNTHKELYLEGCEKEQVEPFERIMGATTKAERGTGLHEQRSLEGWTVAKEPRWSKEGLKEHIIELVVVDDQAFSLVDRAAFRSLLMFQRPATKDSDIPHRTTVANAVHEKAQKVRDRLKGLFACVPGEVSMTLDGWSSLARDPYLGVTVHWVHSAPESPTEWSLRTLLLAFREVKGNHSGENLANLVMEIIDEVGLSSKIGWITSDNVTSNDRMMAELEDKLDSPERGWKAPQRRVRCLAHIIHLAAKHMVQTFSQDGPLMESENAEDALPPDSNEDSETSYTSGDTLGKLWAFINQVRLSPQASAFFFKCCAEEKLTCLELIKYVRTRWSSMYDLLERAFYLKLGITKFMQLADDSTQVPKLQKKCYADYWLTSNEWKNLDLLRQILKHPALAQQRFSSDRVSTISRAFPTIEFLLSSLEAAQKDDDFIPIHNTIAAGVSNLTKWYRRLDTCDVYAVSNVLNPSVKLAYIKKNWGPDFVLRIKTILFIIFDKYNQTEDNGATAAPTSRPVNNQDVGYGSNWMQQALEDDSDDEDILDPRKELTAYLESKREELNEGIVEWWGHNSTRYPTLSRIARDYLAIQGSSVASERAFSSGRLTGTYLRNRLKTNTFEALQVVKSAFRNGILNVSDEAATHVAIDGLVDEEECFELV